MTDREQATCRGCGKPLRGDAYRYGGRAFDIQTGAEARHNHYGGFVCSRTCDWKACVALERTMPGHTGAQTVPGSHAMQQINQTWGMP
jgi:hypothetical protein